MKVSLTLTLSGISLSTALILMFAVSGISQTGRMDQAAGTGVSNRGYDWLQFGGNPQHDNFNRKEHILSPSNVSGLKQIWQVALPEPPDSDPVYLSAAETVAGVHDAVFVVTKRAHLLAFEAH